MVFVSEQRMRFDGYEIVAIDMIIWGYGNDERVMQMIIFEWG